MIIYLFRSILCLALLLLVYLLFLEKEKMHRFNRWYLLGSIVFACIVPLISFKIQSQSLPIPILQDNYFEIMGPGDINPLQQPIVQKEIANYLIPVLFILYGLVSAILLTRFTRNMYLLLTRAANNKAIMYCGARLVLLKEKVASYSFLNNIFINEEDYADQTIEEELITHELTHVREKHSWDVIFIELLQTIFWINPLFFFYKKAIQLNHEYLADDAVIKTCKNVHAYQYLLLDKASLHNKTYLTSNFNYSVTKKRLIMMTKNTTRTKTILKKLGVIPVLALAVLFFSDMGIAQNPPATNAVRPDKQAPSTKEGISPALQQEFNDIIAKHMTKPKQGYDKLGHVTETERSRLQEIYFKMNTVQQGESKVLFAKRSPRKFSGAPSDATFESLKDPKKFGVWLNGKKINNDELNKYKASDFGDYWSSNLNYTEQMRQNVMRTFNLKVMYEKQAGLMTTEAAAKEKTHDLASIKEQPYAMMYRITTGGRTIPWYVD